MNYEEMKNRFYEIYKDIEIEGADEFLIYLEKATDFFKAPASTMYHCAYEGGLLEHSLNVYDRLKTLYIAEYGQEEFEQKKQTIAIVGLLHDVCKVNTYKKDYKNVKEYSDTGSRYDQKGNYDWVTKEVFVYDEDFQFGHGSKSVYLIQNYMLLTEEEAQAIRYHMGGKEFGASDILEPFVGKVFSNNALATLTHIADTMATFIDETEENE